MKQAKTYERKLRNFLKRMPKSASNTSSRTSPCGAEQAEPQEQIDVTRVMIEGVLQANTTANLAQKALHAIESECVDYNELRVAPQKDITDHLNGIFAEAHVKIEMIQAALRGVFDKTSDVSMDYLAETPKRELRRLLSEMGLNEYASGYLMLIAFGHHAVAVDRNLRDALEIEGLIHPESDLSTVQSTLERVVGRERALAAHQFLRKFVVQQSKVIEEYQKARAEQEARVREAAEKEAAEKAARKAARSRQKAARTRKLARAKKEAGKKDAKKTVKKAAKKSAKKAVKKVAKKTVKKPAGKAAKRKIAKKK